MRVKKDKWLISQLSQRHYGLLRQRMRSWDHRHQRFMQNNLSRQRFRELRVTHKPQIKSAFVKWSNLLARIHLAGLHMHHRIALAKQGERV